MGLPPFLGAWRAVARTAARRIAVCAVLGSSATFAAAAGTVELRFIEPDRYADIGWRTLDRSRNLERLRIHLQGLSTQLPDGQRLTIDVLDVDLAGEEVPGLEMDPVRVLRGRADWPRMHLRWQLVGPGAATRAADEWLSDPVYLDRLAPSFASSEALPYDLRMVDEWFRARILQGQPPR